MKKLLVVLLLLFPSFSYCKVITICDKCRNEVGIEKANIFVNYTYRSPISKYEIVTKSMDINLCYKCYKAFFYDIFTHKNEPLPSTGKKGENNGK